MFSPLEIDVQNTIQKNVSLVLISYSNYLENQDWSN